MDKFILILIAIAISVGAMAIVYRNRIGEKLGQKDLSEIFLYSILTSVMGGLFGMTPIALFEYLPSSDAVLVSVTLIVWTAAEVFFYRLFTGTVSWYMEHKYVYDFVIGNVVGYMTMGVCKVGVFVCVELVTGVMDVIILLMGYFVAGIVIGCHEGKAKVFYEKNERETEFQERRKGIVKSGIVILMFTVFSVLKAAIIAPVAGVIAGILFFSAFNRIKDQSFREILIENE